ncbi:MAG TPA: c-type cytochrome [Bradyrhizobium sp.]|nr:c-type cytochrome [Bradyrhizobium sp.]
MDSKSPTAVKTSVVRNATGPALCSLTAVLIATVATAGAEAAGDAARGEALYRDCQACHSFDKNQIGPMHRGVFGRTAGSVPGFDYSEALKNAKIIWTEANLDKWLADPEVLVPGSKMYFSVDKAGDRADLIAFLKERAK